MTFRQQRDVFRHMAAGALLLLAVGTAAAERLQDQPSVRQFGAADGPISANVTDVASILMGTSINGSSHPISPLSTCEIVS